MAQAQAGALGAGRVNTIKAVKHMRQVARPNASAVALHGQALAALVFAQTHHRCTPNLHLTQGVVQQVLRNRLE